MYECFATMCVCAPLYAWYPGRPEGGKATDGWEPPLRYKNHTHPLEERLALSTAKPSLQPLFSFYNSSEVGLRDYLPPLYRRGKMGSRGTFSRRSRN